MSPKGAATDRLAAIEPMAEFSLRTAKGQRPEIGASDGRTLRTLDEVAREIARQRGLHPRTIWKWYCRARRHGFFGMARVRSDCGKSLFFAKHGAIASYLKRMRIQGKSAVAIHCMLQCKFPGKAPSINTLRSYLKSMHRTARLRDAWRKRGARR